MYDYYSIPDQIKGAEQAIEETTKGRLESDFYRVGIEIYVGVFTDVSGPTFKIDPKDEKGIEIFRSFCRQMAEHYKGLACQPTNL